MDYEQVDGTAEGLLEKIQEKFGRLGHEDENAGY